MNKELLSPFEFADSQLLDLKIAIDPQSTEMARGDDSMNISVGYIPIDTGEDENTGQFNLKVGFKSYPKTKGKRKRKPKPFIDLSIELRCLVKTRFNDAVPETERNLLMKVNALSLLYGEARTHLAALTALSPAGKVMLKTIDPFEVIERLENDKKL
jgi:hypothetical protein